ncbi:E3 ubiquitin-protein ligase rnf213-beta-like isoform X2 [Triplophysa dalaica]|uniref:E3 ubiquitin-protein ligase rnf213-beta-like isoform X2 n=1 Tax=Triplophysa dalaica TaxID=1582913 RepID=UPI0024DFB908|nr:E3 ubiquitin-protein ligase rnf213-beta-like isoform X2 [Triplophysa dalaica]
MPKKKRNGEKGRAQKKGNKKRDASTSSAKVHSQNKRPEGHVEPRTESEPHTQKSSSTVEKWTQTKPVKLATQQTQTELNENKETTESIEQSPEEDKMDVETQRNQGNKCDGEDEDCIKNKKRKVSESIDAEEKRTKPSNGCRDKQAGDEQKDTETKEKHSSKDSQNDTDLKSGTEGGKSNSEAAGNQTKGSKEFSDNNESNEAIVQSPEKDKMEVEVQTQLQRNQGNEIDRRDENCVEKKEGNVSESGCRDKQDGDEQKDTEIKEKLHRDDSQKDTDLRSGTEGQKSYAEAAAGNQTKGSKEQKNQTAANQHQTTNSETQHRQQRKPSPVRAPEKPPMFTFYIYAVLDKRFRFNEEINFLNLLFDNEKILLQITQFVDLHQNGCLIEAIFSIEESTLMRGNTIQYKYAVQQRHKLIQEIALRYVCIPTDTTIKELHLYEGYVSYSSSGSFPDRLKGFGESLFGSADKNIFEGWKTSARVLLDQVFHKWEPSNHETIKTFIQHLNHYKKAFQFNHERRLEFPGNLTPSRINVSELISARLVEILNAEKKTSQSSAGIKSLEVAFSVFKVCRGCGVDLGIKDWAQLCQIVFKNAASLGDLQTQLPVIDHSVIGLINQCGQKLISELVLLVPALHSLRKPEAKSDPGSAVNEERWAHLESIKFTTFRERIRGLSDKRRMILQMIKDHLPLSKDKPYLLTSWLSLVAFEDIPEFAESTGTGPEYLIQSLMYRMEEFEKSVQNTEYDRTKYNIEAIENVLCYFLKMVEEEKERIMESLDSILECCKNVHKSACKIAQRVHFYSLPLLTFQLLLKVVENKHAVLSKGGEEMDQQKNLLLSQLNDMQNDFSKWRDGLFQQPVMKDSKLCYHKEIQLWNGLYGIESAIPDFSQKWKCLLDGDLKRRVSQMPDFDKILICCLEMSSKEIENSHANIQSCFQEHCQLAVKNKCQAKKEGELLGYLYNKHMKWSVLSYIVIESAARFKEDREGRLLDPQSAISFFLTQDNWNRWKLNEEASRLIRDSQSDLDSLIQSLCRGDVTLGHFKTIQKYKSRFEKLYNQYMKNNKEKNISIDVTELLSQRESDMKAFEEQRGHMTVLVNMLGKILDTVHVPELSSLEKEVKNDQQAVSLNELVEVQPYFSKEDLNKKSKRNVLCYIDNFEVQDMAREMHEVGTSSLLLHLWQEKATEYVMLVSQLLILNLTDVRNEIWMPCHSEFFNLGVQIANGTVCFKKVDQALDWCEDGGEGDRLKKELALLASMLDNEIPDKNWKELRFKQIQEYRSLHHAAESAEVIMEIKDKLELQGDFSAIDVLTQVRDDSFKRNTLGSLSDNLVKAKQKLENVKPQHIACLKAFLHSEPLNKWVKTQIESLKDLKTFMDLATIPAGENDVDTDRIANFESAVMGYSPLLYSLQNHAGFEDFIKHAQQVWDALDKDEKLVDKLTDSCRWLDWLKGLRETFGSVEQSSLSQASAINTDGVYHVGWPVDFSGKTCLDNVFNVKVTKNRQTRTYSLDDLLELQNKLMLMSSKGEHGKEQVNKFTQVFEGVQRMGRILLQLRTSGNVLLRDLEAQITCNGTIEHCINIRFSQLKKCVEYKGDVLEELQKLCRFLEDVHNDWCTHLSKMRSQYYALNYYTSEQMAYLCKWVNNVSNKRKPVPQQMWNFLSHVKPDCSINDIREAFETAADPTEPMDQGDVAEEPEQDSDITMDSLDNLWKQFKENMSRFLNDHVDVETLGKILSVLSSMNQMHIIRNIPQILCDGRPNLIQCPIKDVISTTLSFYIECPEQPLPTTDEILMCQEETTTEEVEIFLRRCLGFQGTAYKHNKIYTLVNPGSLTYDVGVALVECFERLEKSAEPHYRLVMVCPVNQDRYVPSFFSNYKVQTGLCVSKEKSEEYLKNHFRIPAKLYNHSRVYPGNLSVWMIASRRPSVGKSLYVKRLFEQFQTEFPEATCIQMRLIEPCVNIDGFVQTLSQRLAPLKEQDPVLLHIDTAAVRCGLEEFLFKLLVLGCLSDSKGNIWKRNTAHFVAIEALQRGLGPNSQTQKTNHGFLHILPTIFCRPPKEVKDLEIKRKKERQAYLDPLMDKGEFRSEDIQRPYQYLRRFNRNENLDRFTYQINSVEGDHVNCLHHLLSNCGLKDPSWAELKHFTWFLNLQLKDCENSLFCDPDFLADNLSGFKDFIVKFMIHMARDFASPSIDISDQSPSFLSQNEDEEDILSKLTIRKRWENESHPYIFFNADHLSMSFLGFHVKTNGRILNAVDPQSGKVLMGNVMSQELFSGLERQRINLCEDFDNLSREDKIQRISFVVGAKKGWEKGKFDPDPTYELTADNVMKMLAIHMRFRCDIPVIIMGETGCGKTRLVRFLCDLQKEGRDVENMKLVKVHGGTNSETIYKKVREAEEMAQNNRQKFEVDTVLFFDEANTTDAIFAIKEVLCDKTAQGYPLKKNSGLKIIAACNPYRRHTTKMIERLERAGLGYRVKAEETEDRLGKVPMRQLVYRVHPLPSSMVPLVWDFGQLSDSSEHSYIRQIVQKQIRVHGLPLPYHKVITEVLAASQRHMRSQADECSFVSLRDVERSMCVLVWFFNHRDYLFPDDQQFEKEHMILKCLVVAVGVCYYPSLEGKELYLAAVSEYFPHPFNSTKTLEQEISSCQDFFLSNIETRNTIAKNLALKENVFLMVVCIELRIPLFLVGKPGSSKSLAKTVVADAMQRQASHCEFFKKLKEVHMVSFQCSPHSSPEGIIGTFWNCARFQKDKKLDEYVSVVVLDEIGLAEDSPRMPLKTLHPLLEDGCIDSERSLPHMKVGFVGISNWALDPAKMNRGIFVSRWDPSEKDLIDTAKGICSSSETVFLKIKHLLPKLAKGFLNICKDDSEQFFGLRDYYSLVKMIFATVKKTDKDPSDIELADAVLRNFSGQRDGFDPLHSFQDLFLNISGVQSPSTLKMIEQNLDHHVDEECRYLLLLTTNSAALYIVQHHIFSKGNNTPPEIVFGSGFPKDQEYAQICRNVSRIKACMETGRTVILLNLLNLYESLYDALNQYYIYLGKQQYVDLGLGSHRVKCRVHKNFRLIVVEDQEKVYKRFPVPLKNRLEKHKVDRSTDMMPWQHRVLDKLRKWAEDFPRDQTSTEVNFSSSDVFVGFHGDACASALLQALDKIQKQANDKEDTKKAKDMQLKSEDNETHQPINEEILMIETDLREEINEIPDEEQDGASLEVDSKVEDAENIETLGEALHLVKMDEDSKDPEATESMESNEIMDEEEEAFETAKSFLLNCATPDAVLRLKYSEEFGNQEKDKLQKIYFHQQSHKSLRDLIESHLKKPDQDKTRFLEVTTFSSLLTGADLRNLAPALGLSAEQVHLLFLHQFDTEASFSSKIRSYLRDSVLSLRILLVQIDMEESLCKNALIASAKYCTMNEILSFKSDASNFYTVFITKLSRIGEQCKTSGDKYIGFQGGVWLSAHIDDLRDSEDMSLDLKAFCGISMSELISSTMKSDVNDLEEMDTNEPESQKESSVHLNSLSLIRSCTQKAVSLLRDTGKKTSRSIERMNILLVLLDDDPAPTGERFQKVLLGRLMTALKQKEVLILNPTDWVYRAAKNREALQEGGTLRHTLWRHLQGILSPLLARVLEVLDRDCNLGLLYGLSDGLVQFWLDIFQDQQLLDLLFTQTASVPEQEINVQCHLFVGEVERPCAAPFSWLIKTYCQSLWEESEFVRGTDQGNKARIQQFVSAVSGSRLGSYIEKLSEREKVEMGHRYLTDYVLLAFKVHSVEELEIFTAALLGCVSSLQMEMSVATDLSPTWILAAAEIYAPRLDTLSHALQLNPQVVGIIKDRIPQKTSPDMCEDILAVGICVEETKLLPLSSFCECQTFLQGVEQLQPCLEQALSPRFRALCSPCCLKQLDSIKSVWQGMLLVCAFIGQVVVKMKMIDERIEAVTLKHCAQLHGLMEGSPNLRGKDNLQQIIRILNDYQNESISRELRFGVKCSVCLEDLSNPTALPCDHVFCLACVEKAIAGGAQKCPVCRRPLPDNYRPTVSRNIDSALIQHNETRKCCNGFFLEVVSRFCLTDEEDPSDDLVELLFSLLISAQGDVYKTRELTPFLECVDQSPVVRSVLLKLLLQYSFKQVKKHIQSYLEDLENKLLDKEDRTELYLLFVKCFQDSLLSSGLNGAVEVKEKKSCLQESVSFLSRIARKQTPSRQDDPAEFLLSMARLRMCLESAARILPKTVGQREGNCEDVELKLLEQVKAVCGYCDNDWYRIYLLRALDRLAGMDCLQMLINSTDYAWIFPAEILRLHRLTPAEVDRFLCCGHSYRTIRDGVGQVMHDGKTNSLREALQAKNCSGPLKNVMLTLAMFRQVTCHLVSPERAIDPQGQDLNVLKDIIRENASGHMGELCTALLSNQIGGPGSPLSLNAGVPAQRRLLLELLVHASAVFYSGNRMLRPLHSISSQPQNVTGVFLPTMPDDHTSDVLQSLNEKVTPYYCVNGHLCVVGKCGKPMESSKCDTCGVPIGGHRHTAVAGFHRVYGIKDTTQPGHILGNAKKRSEAPNRNMSLAQSCVLRLFLHLAMLQGAIHHQQGIKNRIQPAVHNVFEFLWQHLEKDMTVLGKTLNLNMDDTAIVVHLILNRFLETNTVGHQDLSTRRSREEWEVTVCNSIITPVLQDLNRMLNSAQDVIASDNRLSNSPLMKVLKRDPKDILQLPSNCPTHQSAFWSLSPLLTVESFAQQIHQSQAPLLTLFFNKVHCIRQLIHLPTLAALMSDLMKLLPPGSETHTYTIASLLHSISAGYQKKLLSERVDVFMKVWNHLRTEIANDASVGLDPKLCETDMTKDSSGQFLSISRQGPGTCLRAIIDLLSKTHNSLVAEARKLCQREDSDYKVSLVSLCESQLALCHPERQFLPLVLANCHYTLEKGQQTVSSYDYQAIERELGRRFFAGKPRIQSDTEKYLRRQLQDFSEVLTEVRAKIPQEPLRSSVLSSMRSMLRSFTDVCDAVFAVEIGLRFLGKTGGDAQALLLSYLTDSLKMNRQISSSVAEALKDNRLSQCTATWQLLTCWRSEQIMRRGQDPFQRLPEQFRDKLTSEERNQVKVFLGVTDIDIFLLELHEILQLKANNTGEESFSPHWDISSTMESRLEEKNINSLPGLESLSEEITLAKAAEVWKLAVEFKH